MRLHVHHTGALALYFALLALLPLGAAAWRTRPTPDESAVRQLQQALDLLATGRNAEALGALEAQQHEPFVVRELRSGPATPFSIPMLLLHAADQLTDAARQAARRGDERALQWLALCRSLAQRVRQTPEPTAFTAEIARRLEEKAARAERELFATATG